MSDQELKSEPLNNIHFEDGALDLMAYIQFQMAIGRPDADVKSCLAEIAKLPLQDRYVWRIASALKWGSWITTVAALP